MQKCLVDKISCIIFIVGITATIFLEKLLNIPGHLILDVKIMFALTFLTFYITTISTVFLAVGYVKDRLDLVNSIKGVSYIVEIVILVFTFIIFKPRVWLMFFMKGGICVVVGILGQLMVLFRPAEIKRITKKIIKRFRKI